MAFENETNYHIFVRLLYEACHSSEDVDDFDLRSDQPESVEEWNSLLAAQHDSTLRLLRHVQSHADDILQILGPSPVDIIDPPAS